MEELSEIRKLLAQNRKDLLALRKDIEKIKKQLVWSRVASMLRIVLVLIPLLIGIIYLMPVFDQLSENYQTLLRQFNTYQQLPSFAPPPESNQPTSGSDTEINFEALLQQYNNQQ